MEKECLFCEIVAGRREAAIVYQNETVVAFKDINPHAPVHLLIVPRKHIRSINDLTEDDRGIVSDIVAAARDVAKQMSIDGSGYKFLINTERGAGQIIFHLHAHLLGGYQK
jgi:histidine triad (HIT) family protein